jgi:GT2 family glycosyltransferase
VFKTPLTVIIPVYNGLDSLRLLVESLETQYPTPIPGLWFHFCDDGSPDSRVFKYYDSCRFFLRSDVTLTKHKKNLGYTRNINFAIRKLSSGSAFVLLNSDTIVGPNLFESLHKVGLQNKLLGSLSPLSSSATICSLFHWPLGGQNTFSFTPQRISQIVHEFHSAHTLISTPTTVGFCMYVPAEAIRVTGLFDEKLFPRGYGEENEWCLRATRQGLKHFIYTGAYVHHEGGQSFGKEKDRLISKGLKLIARMYPKYSEEVDRFITADSFDCVRLAILSHLSYLERRQTGKNLVMFVSHSDPEERTGGVQTHIRNLTDTLQKGNIDVLNVFHIHGRWKIRYNVGPKLIWEVLLRPSASSLHQAVMSVLPECLSVHIHHTLHFPKNILDSVFEFPGIKKIITCHDYFLACPSINLIGLKEKYCKIPTKKSDCVSCLEKKYHKVISSLEDYRQDSIGLLYRADHILFPSETAKKTLFSALARFVAPEFKLLLEAVQQKSLVLEHTLALSSQRVQKRPPNRSHLINEMTSSKVKKVVFLGGLSKAKGLAIVDKIIPVLRKSGLKVEVWGKTSEGLHSKAVVIREYQGIEELKALRGLAKDTIVVIPSVWPETFCYTAHEAVAILETPIVAFNLGHPAQMIHRWRVGTLASEISPKSLLSAITQARRAYPHLLKKVAKFCRDFPRHISASEEAYLQLYRPSRPFRPQVFSSPLLPTSFPPESPLFCQTKRLADTFETSRPFKHIVIDQFLEPDVCANLLENFPVFESGDCLNEAGQKGGKSTRADVRNLGEAYRKFDDVMRSPEFLQSLGEVTGIPNLIYDPEYVGGGTHENRPGQDLDYHIDFNHHPQTRHHRRLNLILFLNPEWQTEWGGCLQLTSNPRARNAQDGESVFVEPHFNRCVVFETTEKSWHGFDRIQIPKGGPSSRKSIAVYFYSQTRPSSELGEVHSTVYKNRPLPSRFRAGYTLGNEDESLLSTLIVRRDQHIDFLYQRQSQLLAELGSPEQKVSTGKESLSCQPLEPAGFVKALSVKDLYDDKWVGPQFEIQAVALSSFTRFNLKGWTPEWSAEGRKISIFLNDQKIREFSVMAGRFDCELPIPLQPSQLFVLKVECSTATVPKSLGISDDLRPLSWLLDSATLEP